MKPITDTAEAQDLMPDHRMPCEAPLLCADNVARWCGGHWESPPTKVVAGLAFDSREIREGDLFAALVSEKADGHRYVEKALSAGAAGAIVREDWVAPCEGLPLLRVADPLQAMHDIARGYRLAVAPFIVGVTGSVGKSTVKTWTAALLGRHFRTAATVANFNNNIGLPVSLLAMSPDTEKGVFEIGMNHKGELAPLCRTLCPNAAIVTAIGPVHIEFFPSVEAIADEKAELLRAIPDDGFAVLDAGSPYFGILAAATKARVVTVRVCEDSTAPTADYEARPVDTATGSFELGGRRVAKPTAITTGHPGAHNILNALYAMAAALECGVPFEKVVAGAASLPSMAMRFEREVIDGVTWVNDAYNASPLSMAASLKAFAATTHKEARRIYVLGEMRELGAESRRHHDAIGALIALLGGDVLIGVGEAGGWIIDAAVAGGFDGDIVRVGDAQEAGSVLKGVVRPGDSVLIKASHGVGLFALRRH